MNYGGNLWFPAIFFPEANPVVIWLLHVTTHLRTGNAPPSTPAIGTLESLIASSRDPLVDLGGAEQRTTLRGISHALAGAL